MAYLYELENTRPKEFNKLSKMTKFDDIIKEAKTGI
jgi:hypothetical protein